jgi:hypothetical protein
MRNAKIFGLLAILLLGTSFYIFGGSVWRPALASLSGSKPESPDARRLAGERMMSKLAHVGFTQMPSRVALLAFKTEKRLELWAEKPAAIPGQPGDWTYVRSYPILAASGKLGPKLKEGDRQVPEGIYRITYLNPNSNFHLSMKLDYPNAFDKQKAAQDGRTNLGGDICVHGWEVSIGCIAIGNIAIEEIYNLCDKVGQENTEVIIAPYDFRKAAPIVKPDAKVRWLPELYASINQELQKYTVSGNAGKSASVKTSTPALPLNTAPARK